MYGDWVECEVAAQQEMKTSKQKISMVLWSVLAKDPEADEVILGNANGVFKV